MSDTPLQAAGETRTEQLLESLVDLLCQLVELKSKATLPLEERIISASALVMDRPHLSNKEIAARCGLHPSQLSNAPIFKAFRSLARQPREVKTGFFRKGKMLEAIDESAVDLNHTDTVIDD